MEKREKLKEKFQLSRAKIKTWEAQFLAQHQRKPNREEIKAAPEQIQICYKNCKKIKAYLEAGQTSCNGNETVVDEDGNSQASQASLLECSAAGEPVSSSSLLTSFSGLVGGQSGGACRDISNKTVAGGGGGGGVWGAHLNKKPSSRARPAAELSSSFQLGLLPSQVAPNRTRTSLKRRKSAFQSFTETLGEGGAEDLSSATPITPSSLSQPATPFPTFPSQQQLPETESSHSSPTPTTDPVPTQRTTFSGLLDPTAEPAPAPALRRSLAVTRPAPAARPGRQVDSGWLSRCTGEKVVVPEELPASTLVPVPSFTTPLDPAPAPATKPVPAPAPVPSVTSTRSSVASPPPVVEESPVQPVHKESLSVELSALPTAEKSNIKKTNNKKRKRTDQEDSEEEMPSEPSDDDGDDYEVKDVKVDRKKKKTVTKAKKPQKKKAKKIDSSEGEVADEAGSVAEEGPSATNVFALGFEETRSKVRQVKKGCSAQERLEQRVKSGKEQWLHIDTRLRTCCANDGFLKIDLKKKSYSRGKRGMTGAKFKRAEYQRKVDAKEGRKVKEYKCYQCGEVGHMAYQCTGGRGDSLIPTELADQFDPGEFPSLEEARDMASGVLKSKTEGKVVKLFSKKQQEEVGETTDLEPAAAPAPISVSEQRADPALDIDSREDAELLAAAMEFECSAEATAAEEAAQRFAVAPLESSEADIDEALARFGYPEFRPGQREAIVRVLAGQSTLVLLATGTGKSLIYQLPALLYRERGPCISLVVSPLISLMEDQVTGLPPFLRAAALHYNMTDKAKEKVAEDVKSGKLHFLLVSPEAVAGGGGVFGSLLPNLPPIAFVCIDEAHCVSHWSHNFRPSYLRLARIVRERLGVRTVLGLTATAPESLTRSVAGQLGVPGDGVIRGPLLPGNLTLTASRDGDRDNALLQMLTEGALAECDSVIVYCTRREECERVATLVRTRLQDRDLEGAERRERKTRVSVVAEPYHAGMSAFRRKTVQGHFMSGRLRVVVATVAFGMGIDKRDIRAIVHYNMPRTFESYIQEIGRAGRDGLPARGHLFLDCRGGDVRELKRHIFGNSVDRHTIRKFVAAVLGGEAGPGEATGQYRETAVSVETLVEQLDLPEENIATLLCYLEDCDPPQVRVANHVYSAARVQCYGGPRQLRQAAAGCPPLAAAVALQRQAGVDLAAASSLEFPVVEVSAKMGWDSSIVKKELKNLEWVSSGAGWKRSGVKVEFSNLAFHFSALTGLTDTQLDGVLEELYTRVETRERAELWGLARLGRAFSAVCYPRQGQGSQQEDAERSDKLKSFVRDYFQEAERLVPDTAPECEPCQDESGIRGDIRSFVSLHSDHSWTGRAVARVLHGIQSPNYPAKQWGRVYRFWRKHLDTDFNLLVRLATEEILGLRGARR